MLRVNQLIGFGGGSRPAIEVTDNGDDSTPVRSGGSNEIHTFTATSTRADTIICVTWSDLDPRTISSVTFDGNAATELVQALEAAGGDDVGAAIYHIAGAHTGDVVVTFSGGVDDSALTVLSLDNLQSATAVDTDTDEDSGAGSTTLAALTAPPAGGIRIAVYCNQDSATATTWTWAGHTEASDLSNGTSQHSVAYLVDDAGGNITADAGADDAILVGVSLR